MLRPWLPRLPQRRAPARPAPVPAPIAMLAREEFEDMPLGGHQGRLTPLGGHQGRLTPLPPREPPAPAPQPLVFEPPPWAGRESELLASLAPPEPAPPAVSAVEAMFENAAALGELGQPPTVGPPARPLGPLPRFEGVPTDWEAVERQAIRENRRAERERALALLNEEEEPARHPPARRGAA